MNATMSHRGFIPVLGLVSTNWRTGPHEWFFENFEDLLVHNKWLLVVSTYFYSVYCEGIFSFRSYASVCGTPVGVPLPYSPCELLFVPLAVLLDELG